MPGEGAALMLRPVVGQAEPRDWLSYRDPMELGREVLAQSEA